MKSQDARKRCLKFKVKISVDSDIEEEIGVFLLFRR